MSEQTVNELFEDMYSELAKQCGRPGWRYHDLPKLSEEYFDKFVSVAGADNIHWITLAEYRSEDIVLKRGQMLISPEGVSNLQAYTSNLS